MSACGIETEARPSRSAVPTVLWGSWPLKRETTDEITRRKPRAPSDPAW